jgi:hypothetical protein
MTTLKLQLRPSKAAPVITTEEHVRLARAESKGIPLGVRGPPMRLSMGTGKTHLLGLEEVTRGEGAVVNSRVEAGYFEA